MLKKCFSKLSLIGFMAITSSAFGDANIVAKQTLDAHNGVSYPEGQTVYFSINLFHGCHDHETGESFATTDVSAIFPNSEALEGVAYTVDWAGQRQAANALMRIKPSVDSDWKKIKVNTHTVPEYWSRAGLSTTDTSSIYWRRGYVPDNSYDSLELQANLPFLDGCVDRLRIFIPAVQYCENGDYAASIREPTEAFGEVGGFTAFLDVVRDLDSNPLPQSCSVGTTYNAYPSTGDIDTYLPISRKHKHQHN